MAEQGFELYTSKVRGTKRRMMAKQLTFDEAQKLLQLKSEMENFPPDHFESENLDAWAGFFETTPRNLEAHTDNIAKVLDRTYRLLRSEGAAK